MAEISNQKECEDWLKGRPKEWAQMLAARIALRILPTITSVFDAKTLNPSDQQELAFSIFRATSISWVARRYPTHDMRAADVDAAATAAYAAHAVSAADAAYAAAAAADAAYVAAASSAASAAAAAQVAATVYAAATYTAHAATAVDIWVAINADAEFLLGADGKKKAAAERLAGKDLWLNRRGAISIPKWCIVAFDRLEHYLLELDDNWQVWTQWYRPLLQGEPGWGLKAKNAEDLMVRITTQDEDFWNAGANEVNAKIAAWLEEFRAQEEAEKLPPPGQPLGSNTAATGFIFNDGIIDTAPPTAWENDTERAEKLRESALEIARKLQEKFQKTDAEPHLAATVGVGLNILKRPVSTIHPDELRLFAQSISAVARTYGHPNAEWELGADAVQNLFEISVVLEDLQGIVKSDLQKNAEAIRALEITPEDLEKAKSVNNDIQLAVNALSPLFSERAGEVFRSADIISRNAPTQTVQISVEGGRILITENLVLAIARILAETDAQAVFKEVAPDLEIPSNGNDEVAVWSNFVDRFLTEFSKDLPEELAKGLKKNLVKSIGVLGGVLVAAVYALGPLITAASITTAASWLVYLLRKKQQELDDRNNTGGD